MAILASWGNLARIFGPRGREGVDQASFAVPAGGGWLKVDLAQKAFPAVVGSAHEQAVRIYPGQAVLGSFVAGGDPSGVYSDYNDYFFIGTAGSRVSVSLERLDTSKPWEDPSSLDPQVGLQDHLCREQHFLPRV